MIKRFSPKSIAEQLKVRHRQLQAAERLKHAIARPALPSALTELSTEDIQPVGQPPSLALGVITAPRSGVTTLLNSTLQSTRHAGFNQHIDIFAQVASPVDIPVTDDNSTVYYDTHSTGIYANWARAAKHMLATTTAEWLMILQDDIEWCDNAADVLYYTINQISSGVDGVRLHRLGLLSCYTSPAMIPHEHSSIGWTEAKFAGKVKGLWGALTLCFPRHVLHYVVTHPTFVNYTSTRALDYLVGDILRTHTEPPLGVKVHIPSLVEHKGEISTIFSQKTLASNHIQRLRHGYRYDKRAQWLKHN